MPSRCSSLASTDDGRTTIEWPPPSKRLSEAERQQMEGHQPYHGAAINTLNRHLTTWFPNNFIDRDLSDCDVRMSI
jgi:hypothetical protein